MKPTKRRATRLLEGRVSGDPNVLVQLMPLVYDELRRLARHYMKGERAEHTLQPTALVHEAYFRLVDMERIDWQGKTHFFAVAATQMRRVLIEHARRRSALKRGAECTVRLDESIRGAPARSMVDVLALDAALERLAGRSRRQAQVAEMRLFSGLSVDEIAAQLRVSAPTVKNDWRAGRAWLTVQLRDRPAPPPRATPG